MGENHIKDSSMEYAIEGGREVRVFRDGGDQVVSIPKEFELEGARAIIRRVGEQLIIEPVRRPNFIEYLRQRPPEARNLPDLHDDPPPHDVVL